MKLEGFECPLCGSQLDVELDQGVAICPSCGSRFPLGNASPVTNGEGSATSDVSAEEGVKLVKIKRKGKKQLAIITALIITVVCSLVYISCAVLMDGSRTSSSEETTRTVDLPENDDSVEDNRLADSRGKGGSSTKETVTTKDLSAVWELGVGFYTAGIDIPAGRFNVTPTGGIGFIHSENDSVNLRGPGHEDQTSYADSYRNYKLIEGETLEVQGVTIRIDYSSVLTDAQGRHYDESRAIELTPGNYIVGEDIEAGIYNIRFVEGSGGFISSDRQKGNCILHANMDGNPDTDQYTDNVSNALLVEGEELQVTSGLKLLFIPEQTRQQ